MRKLDKYIMSEFNFIGKWIASETRKRKYSDEELKQLSKSLINVKQYIERGEKIEENNDKTSN